MGDMPSILGFDRMVDMSFLVPSISDFTAVIADEACRQSMQTKHRNALVLNHRHDPFKRRSAVRFNPTIAIPTIAE